MAVEPRVWRKLNSALNSLKPKVVDAAPSDINEGAECQCDHPDCPIGCPKECDCPRHWKDEQAVEAETD